MQVHANKCHRIYPLSTTTESFIFNNEISKDSHYAILQAQYIINIKGGSIPVYLIVMTFYNNEYGLEMGRITKTNLCHMIWHEDEGQIVLSYSETTFIRLHYILGC